MLPKCWKFYEDYDVLCAYEYSSESIDDII